LKKFTVTIPQNENKEELIKTISFVSEDIINYEIDNEHLHFFLSDDANVPMVLNDMNELLDKYTSVLKQEEVIFENKLNLNFTSNIDILKSNLIYKYDDGVLSFRNEAQKLYSCISKLFRESALNLNCEERMYPILLPLNFFKRTNYLKTSPQHLIFCCDVIEGFDHLNSLFAHLNENRLKENISNPKFALSPSACFHVYIEYEGKILSSNIALTFEQKVFRNEGRFSWNDFGRLKDYSVRELVFMGDQTYVNQKRNDAIEVVKNILLKLKLGGSIVSSSDSFIVPNFQRYKRVQLLEKSKYELRIEVDGGNIACASFNLHGISFTKPFDIKVNNTRSVSGCVGFGIDRWVLAFLSQHGLDSKKWPIRIQ